VRALAVLLLLLPAASGSEPSSAPEKKPVWLAVGGEALLAPLKPLAAHRAKQGLRPVLHAGADVAAAVKEHEPAFLLLVGDEGEADAAWRVPARRAELYRWRKVQPKTFATDAAWADCPVGRIPARTPGQVALAVAKTLRYETRPPRLTDLRLVGWAGAPGYGGAVDSMATGLFVQTVRDNAPAWADAWLLSGDAKADLCGWPPEQPARFAEELARGSFLSAVAAHASRAAVFSMRFDGEGVWFTGRELRGVEPGGPLVLLACNCGEFDAAGPSLGERLLFHLGGPAAVVAATTESHPLPNYYTGVALLQEARDGDAFRLGSFWKATKARGGKANNPMIEFALKDVEGKLEPRIDVDKLRRDQKRLYALLGDPALRLRWPRKLEATAERRDGRWHWKATRPEGATAIHVGVRDPGAGWDQPADPDSEAGRRTRLERANAAHAYRPVEGAGWEGSTGAEGTLRLVAVGPDALWVAVFGM